MSERKEFSRYIENVSLPQFLSLLTREYEEERLLYATNSDKINFTNILIGLLCSNPNKLMWQPMVANILQCMFYNAFVSIDFQSECEEIFPRFHQTIITFSVLFPDVWAKETPQNFYSTCFSNTYVIIDVSAKEAVW